jgi:type II secretory pathway pseudopilin PulG
LIEILVAFTVLALVAVPAMQVASGHLRALRISEQYARATSLARSKLDELVALSKLGAERPVLEGVTGSGGAEFDWTIEVVPYVDESLPDDDARRLGLALATVSVGWVDARRERLVKLQTLLLEPPS